MTPAEIDSVFIHFFLGRGVNAVRHMLPAHEECVLTIYQLFNYLLPKFQFANSNKKLIEAAC